MVNGFSRRFIVVLMYETELYSCFCNDAVGAECNSIALISCFGVAIGLCPALSFLMYLALTEFFSIRSTKYIA